jgi:hypothetical protein
MIFGDFINRKYHARAKIPIQANVHTTFLTSDQELSGTFLGIACELSANCGLSFNSESKI